ncbi:hypothetical protein [Cupriavidus sp. RAF12]|uniref:hypothetical protein n=1 Tax=Cupriavidus sp. RAF12 TaxID=3233050 RepID=UPI003F8F4B07
MNRNDWSYWRYVQEVTLGMGTAWARFSWYTRDVVEGAKALAFVLGLLLLPLLVPFAPLLALVARASDRRDAQHVEKLRAETEKLRAEARARIRMPVRNG